MRYVFSIFLLTATTLYAGNKLKEIVTYQLNSKRIFTIKTYLSKGVTTVMFPGQIEGIAAGNVALNKVHHNVDGSPICDFVMSFKPGNYYFSIRALKQDATGTLNIIYRRNAYSLKLHENEENAMSTVNFSDSGKVGMGAERSYRPPSIAVLKGLLDKAKSFDVLKKKYPVAVSGVTLCKNECVSDYKEFTATIVRAWRFDNYNSLVFMVELKNKTREILRYLPEKTAFAVLDERLYPALIDASGTMPPASTSVAFFVVSSTADGRKNKFAANNDWKVLINAKTKELK